MRKLFVFALISFCHLVNAAENDPSTQDVDQQEVAQVEIDSSLENQEEGSDLIASDVLESDEDEEESSVRFIPTEQISQDFGVSFPVDI